MEQQQLLDELAGNPRIFADHIDFQSRQLICCTMTADSYAQSAWLDHRKVTRDEETFSVPVAAVARRLAELPARRANAAFIFHTAHCGSTLLSRCIGALGNNLVLREPVLLRQLADLRRSEIYPRMLQTGQWQNMLLSVRQLLSRTFHDTEIAVVKANSTCHNLIPELLNNTSPSRGLFLYSSLADHLASMLKGKRIDIYTDLYFETFRHDLISQDIIKARDIDALAPLEKIILMWLGRVLYVLDCFARDPVIHLRTLDFRSFMNSPQTLLPLVSGQLGIHATDDDIERVVTSDLLNREAKLGNRQYDAQQREREQQAIYAQHRKIIESGIRWAEQFMPHASYLEQLPHALQ